jgi:hypothetical protein
MPRDRWTIEMDPLERTGCAILAAGFSCVILVAISAWFVFLARGADGSGGWDDLIAEILFALFSSIGIIGAWLLALIATCFRRRAAWLLIIETPLLAWAVYLLIALSRA